MAATPGKSEKEKIFESWDATTKTLDASSLYSELLKGLMTENNELYKMACSLTEIYTNAHILQPEHPNICEFLNEWLNKQKPKYIKNEDDMQNKKLWNDYIEKLWIELEKDNDRYYWCRRNFSSSLVANALTISFAVLISTVIIFSLIYKYSTMRNFLHAYINKKIKLKQYSQKGISNELLETIFKYGNLHARNKRINLSYSS
ncbi:PIR Superfamily Protein [Plasmodium ovale wallikeri]|uniref:PIR Superfamily Protein n=1 Tax=Plasmodium ovale wallikeri TaxID=864142 RepID=A0A1A9AMJ7_PLAOA|nr:PIR Superfamily Protein [Plasmodium ovale wallikeri]